MQKITAELRLRNLQNAVLLAQQAATGRGPLVEHFAKLGLRFSHELNRPPHSDRTSLRVIDGGAHERR